MNENDQAEYDVLVKEIFKNNNLSEADRIRFYALHVIVKTPVPSAAHRMFAEHRRLKRFNERVKLSSLEHNYISNILEEKRNSTGLNRYEYNYLSYLNWRYRLKLEVTFPCYPDILPTTLEQLRLKVAFNESRQLMFEKFIQCLEACKLEYQLETVNVILGGSFFRIEREDPSDIDFILLLPIQKFQEDYSGKKKMRIVNRFKVSTDEKNIIDLYKLPDPYDDDLYMAYELLTLLGNTPGNYLDINFKNNDFICHSLYKLKFP